jgi:tetratricopeptide (TPR) repeat protein
VLENSAPGIPLWLNEGIAEFYSTFAIRGGNAVLGLPIVEHLWWLKSRGMLSIAHLFSVTTSSREYNESERQGTYYAQSWALAHYLLVDPDRRSRMGRLMRMLAQGIPSAEAFERALEIDLLTAEQELTAHVRGGADRYLRYAPEEALEEQEAEATPLPRKEVLYHLGDLLAHRPPLRPGDAERHLRAALALDETYADAYVGLVALRLAEGRAAEATELGEQALVLAPENARALVLLGMSFLDGFVSAIDEEAPVPIETPPALLEARQRFRAALELSPEHIDALIGLGTTFVFDVDAGEVEEGIGALARAFEARPARMDVLASLIRLTALSGNLAGARSLLDRALRPRGDAELIQAAEAALVQVEIDHVRRLMEENKTEEAVATAKRIAREVMDHDLRARVLELVSALTGAQQTDRFHELRDQAIEASKAGDAERTRELLEQAAEISQQAEVSSSDVELYNEGIRLANEGKLDEAAQRFEEVSRTTSRPDVADRAANHAANLRRVLANKRNVAWYNEAVDAFNAGRIDDAAAVLDRLLAAQPEGELLVRAERLGREIERARGRKK